MRIIPMHRIFSIDSCYHCRDSFPEPAITLTHRMKNGFTKAKA